MSLRGTFSNNLSTLSGTKTNYIYYIYIKGVLNSPFILSNNIHEKAEV
nr:MAG TPA: hypothetical protein [Caudoviricetes sp.]